MVATAAVMISRGLQILASHPVVGLLDALSPLQWRVQAGFGGRLAFVSLRQATSAESLGRIIWTAGAFAISSARRQCPLPACLSHRR